MKRGIALLDTQIPEHLKEAVEHFDAAIALRQTLPLNEDPLYRYGLAAGWINRGDALARLSSPENLKEALRSYDMALAVLRDLPLEVNPLFRKRLAIAWHNRGLALELLGADAERSFEAARDAICHEGAASLEDRDVLLASILTNYARVLAQGKSIDSGLQARRAAREAMTLSDPAVRHDIGMAEANLKARHVLCLAITRLLIDVDPAEGVQRELIGEATDAAEEGMALSRDWVTRGARQFHSFAQDFYTFAVNVYRVFQPQFVNEFLLEHLDPALFDNLNPRPEPLSPAPTIKGDAR